MDYPGIARARNWSMQGCRECQDLAERIWILWHHHHVPSLSLLSPIGLDYSGFLLDPFVFGSFRFLSDGLALPLPLPLTTICLCFCRTCYGWLALVDLATGTLAHRLDPFRFPGPRLEYWETLGSTLDRRRSSTERASGASATFLGAPKKSRLFFELVVAELCYQWTF